MSGWPRKQLKHTMRKSKAGYKKGIYCITSTLTAVSVGLSSEGFRQLVCVCVRVFVGRNWVWSLDQGHRTERGERGIVAGKFPRLFLPVKQKSRVYFQEITTTVPLISFTLFCCPCWLFITFQAQRLLLNLCGSTTKNHIFCIDNPVKAGFFHLSYF